MKAIQLVEVNHPLELREIPTPDPGHGEVLVQIKAAGICHSDAHYRAGKSPVEPLPCTLGHEAAGVIAAVGPGVTGFTAGDRVCLHYLISCGHCAMCHSGQEQFCTAGTMIGKYRDGGYAEYISMPARSVFHLPEEIPFDQGAIMMCSSATSLHALYKARIATGETVAVFGIGGLGISAVQLAFALGADRVFAVDIKQPKLDRAAAFGAAGVNAANGDPVEQILEQTDGRGVDVALELIGLPLTMEQSVKSLAPFGRAALAGITTRAMQVFPYTEVIGKEAEIIGVCDHLASEMPLLLEFARTGKLDLSQAVSATVPLDADTVNGVLDRLEQFSDTLRTVIVVTL